MSSIFMCLLLAVLVSAGCGKQESSAPATPPPAQASMEDQAKAMAQEGIAKAKDLGEDVKSAAAGASASVKDKVQELVAKAREYVDSGKFSEAMAKAQEALKLDPGNLDAQRILDTAKAKLAELGAKASELKQNLTNQLGNFGK